MIAPSSPPRMTVGSTTLRSIIPLPIVFAIAVPNTNAATKFQNAAQKTAACGDSTRVLTTVAIELAASWKPLMKSNSSARAMIPRTCGAMALAVLEDDGLDDVGHVLAQVRGRLEAPVPLLPPQPVDLVG